MTKLELIKKVIEWSRKQQELLDSLPQEFAAINEAIIDHEYLNIEGHKFDLAFIAVLGEDLANDVYWYMYDKSTFKITDTPDIVTANGIEYRISSDEEYYTYLEAEYTEELT